MFDSDVTQMWRRSPHWCLSKRPNYPSQSNSHDFNMKKLTSSRFIVLFMQLSWSTETQLTQRCAALSSSKQDKKTALRVRLQSWAWHCRGWRWMPPSHGERLGPRPGENRRTWGLMIAADNRVMINLRMNERKGDTDCDFILISSLKAGYQCFLSTEWKYHSGQNKQKLSLCKLTPLRQPFSDWLLSRYLC